MCNVYSIHRWYVKSDNKYHIKHQCCKSPCAPYIGYILFFLLRSATSFFVRFYTQLSKHRSCEITYSLHQWFSKNPADFHTFQSCCTNDAPINQWSLCTVIYVPSMLTALTVCKERCCSKFACVEGTEIIKMLRKKMNPLKSLHKTWCTVCALAMYLLRNYWIMVIHR